MNGKAQSKMIKMYGGFVDGKLHVRLVDSGFGGWGKNFSHQPALFLRKADAQKEYQDVRPVSIEAAAA